MKKYFPLPTQLLLSVSILFFLPIILLAQSACGDVVVIDQSGFEERTPVEDCDNPFNADSPEPFDVTLIFNGEVIVEGSELIVSSNSVVSGEYSLSVPPGNFAFTPFTLYVASSSDYHQVIQPLDTTFSLSNLDPGEYTAVFLYEDAPIFSGQTNWFNKLKNFFISTTLAFYPDATDVVVINFTVANEVSEPQGASSVLFLPGIQASRLYKDALVLDDKLWEPLNNGDIRDLEMTSTGESVEEIYTRDIIQKIFGVGGDVYAQFIDFLTDLEDDEVIADFKTFPYDWRYSVIDIVENGTLYGSSGDTSRVYPTVVLQQLAAESLTGKVTIVAHSNGGLLAKAIMADLEANGQEELVDNIVLLGSPQLGTPKAIATVLHGYEQQIAEGFIAEDEVIREVIINMPGAYGLLPSEEYFERGDDPVVAFVVASTTTDFITEYGEEISTFDDQTNFMVGTEGRGTATTIEAAALANDALLSEAADYHKNQLDNWEAPVHVKVVQVAGVGVETEIGFRYEEFTEQKCITSGQSIVCTEEKFYKPYPVMTPYGDETVVADSAVGYEGGDTYFFNLFLADEFQHSNLTESESVQKLVENVLFATTSDISLISDSRPNLTSDKTVIGGHSPISLLLEDADGNRLGVVDGEIIDEVPRADYRELAGSKYLIVPNDIEYDVTILGQADGGATITFDDLSDSIERLIKVPIATVTASTTITFSKAGDSFSGILVDVDGDGVVDSVVSSDGDESEPPALVTYTTLLNAIETLEVGDWQLKQLTHLVKRAEKFGLRDGRYAKRIEQLYLKILNHKLVRLERLDRISLVELEQLQGIISKLKS